MEPYFEYKDPSIEKKVMRLVVDPIKGLFFQKEHQSGVEEDLKKQVFELFGDPEGKG